MEELPEILKAFHIFDQPKKPYRPKLTIVICGKRHHTRFYPTEKKDAAHDGNPKPGTVVDRGVTALCDFDFFLQGECYVAFLKPCCIYFILPTNIFRSPWRFAGHDEANPLLCRS